MLALEAGRYIGGRYGTHAVFTSHWIVNIPVGRFGSCMDCRPGKKMKVMSGRADSSLVECPNCRALYKVVRLKRHTHKQPVCRECGAPLQGRAGSFALRYSLVKRSSNRGPASASGQRTSR